MFAVVRSRIPSVRVILASIAISILAATASATCPSHALGSGADEDALEALFGHDGLIRKGEKGALVRTLQEVLGSVGYEIASDGVFGEETRSCLSEYQADRGLYPDGIAGPATLAVLSRDYYRRNPPSSHMVRTGETLDGIADLYGLHISTLVGINGISDPDVIYAGQALYLRAPVAEDESSAGNPAGDASSGPDGTGQSEAHLPPDTVVPVPSRRICLTFDDGPDIYTTRPILAVLHAYGVRATFFLIGDSAAKYPDLVREIDAAGHVIGVHGYDHKVLSSLSAAEVRRDLKKAQDTLSSIAGKKPWLYRPPMGMLDRTQVDEAEKLGMATLMWTNIGGADLGAETASEVVSRVTEGARDGGVILLHEGLQHVVEALPALIEALARLGFGFQNVSSTSASTR